MSATKEEIANLIAYALQTGQPPAYVDHSPIESLGEDLSEPIFWTGRQWAVTAHGIEARDGKYAIEGTRVWEQEEEYGWIKHMSGKGWVDIQDFAEALRIARQHWPKK